MSLFHWFAGKPKTKNPPSFQSRPHTAPNRQALPDSQPSAGRKHDRTERHDLLCIVVREAMTRVGVPFNNYKFKVLSLDQRSAQFLVMVDLAPQHATDTAHLRDMETQIVQAARSGFDIPVTAVYWRINDQIASAPRPAPLSPAAAVTPPPPRFEASELAAFKQALAKTTAARPVTTRNAPLLSPERTGFEDTIVPDYDPRPFVSSLSTTQYGDLH